MLVPIIIVFGLYAALVLLLCWGWALLDEKNRSTTELIRRISVIVPFRNEEVSLPQLIGSLKKLNYPPQKCEFIFVDDHSEDSSLEVARQLVAKDERFVLVSSSYESHGKKRALTRGVAAATGDIVVTTDADCEVPVDWLSSINNNFALDSIKMIVGPVRLASKSWVGRTQAIEFASLIGSVGATLAFNRPTMCSAANLSFRRESFYDVDGFSGNEHVSSGDDQFLMKKFSAKWRGSIRFLYDSKAVVTAAASETLYEFFHQRLRWAGKWRLTASSSSILALFVLGFHMSYMWMFSMWIYGSLSTPVFLVLAGARLFTEVIFLLPVCRFLGTRWSWSSFLFLQFFYPIYVVSIGFLSLILKTRWKGREVMTRVWTGIS